MLGSGPVPPDDGTRCYPQRRAFYSAANDARRTQSFLEGLRTFAPALFQQVGISGSAGFDQLLATQFDEALDGFIAGISADNALARRVTTTFEALHACRVGEVADINDELRAGEITREAAMARIERIKSLAVADADVARAANEALQSRADEYQVAAQKARTRAVAADTPTERRERTERVDEVETKLQTNQRVLNEQQTTVARVERESTGFSAAWRTLERGFA